VYDGIASSVAEEATAPCTSAGNFSRIHVASAPAYEPGFGSAFGIG
jgi:hypothetical protein